MIRSFFTHIHSYHSFFFFSNFGLLLSRMISRLQLAKCFSSVCYSNSNTLGLKGSAVFALFPMHSLVAVHACNNNHSQINQFPKNHINGCIFSVHYNSVQCIQCIGIFIVEQNYSFIQSKAQTLSDQKCSKMHFLVPDTKNIK